MARRDITSLPVLALAGLLLLPGGGTDAPGAWAATASGARLGLHGEGITRFVTDLSGQVSFHVATLTDPHRVVIDVPGLEWQGPAALNRAWGAVNGVRGGDGRIILDLRKPAVVKSAFLIPPRDQLGWRLVVDLSESAATAAPSPPAGTATPPSRPVAAVAVSSVPVPTARPAPTETPPESIPEPMARPVAGGRIVVTSPNAQPPADRRTTTTAASPAIAIPAAVTVAEPAATTDRPARSGAILSAPMPPPPGRPADPPPPPARASDPAPARTPEPVLARTPEPPPPRTPEPVLAAPRPDSQTAALAPPPPMGGDAAIRPRDGLPVIVIDPGHGGVDPGAISISGYYEKHITLAMARELKAALEKTGRYRVHLTRDRDVFIRLRDRVAIARQHGADLFISLHADAVQSPTIRGLSIYTLSQNASDSEAQALAEKENKVDLIGGIDLSHESADVAGILIDLAQRETMNRSAGFASEVVDEVGQEFDLLDNTHRFAGFAVLKAPDVPAVLVEMGYLSNDYEEKQLRQPGYRARMAKAITRAIDRFFPSTQKTRRPAETASR